MIWRSQDANLITKRHFPKSTLGRVDAILFLKLAFESKERLMSDELEVEDDVFLEQGVFYCTCGNPIEGQDASGMIKREAGKQFVACPMCDTKHFAESGKFLVDE